MPIPAVVLAAGEGTRLLPFTSTEPKVMLPVGNRPILEHVLRALKEASVRDVVLVVGYKHERVRNAVGDGRRLGLRVRYVFQEKQLGTANALTTARKHLKGRFLVLNGDNPVEGPALKEFLGGPQQSISVLGVRRSDVTRRALVVERGRLRRVRPLGHRPEKGELANTGIFLFTPDIFREIEGLELSARGEYEIIDAVQAAVERGTPVAARTTRHGWDEVVTPLDLLRANSAALDRILAGSPARPGDEPGARIQGPVSIGAGTKIRAGSYISGPVSIGSNCDIGPYAVVLPSTSIGDGSRIGPFCYVRNSVLMSDVHVEPYAHAANSIVGHNARVGAGVHLESRPDDAGAPGAELGALVGEGAVLGDHVLVHAGALLGVRCTVGPGATVRKNVPDGATVL